MKNAPAFQFYVRDWLSDADVRVMSDREYRVYVELLCLCWEADGLPSDLAKLSKLCGMSKQAFDKVWNTIGCKFKPIEGKRWNERLYEQKQRNDERRKKASEAGCASVISRGFVPKSVEHPLNERSTTVEPRAPARVAAAVEEEAFKPDDSSPARSRAKGFPPPADDPLGEGCPGFVEFYESYPKHQGRRDAYRAWHGIKPDAALQQVILAHVAAMRRSWDWRKENGQYVPLPATYLNGRRWTDVVPSQNGAARNSKPEPEPDGMRIFNPTTGELE